MSQSGSTKIAGIASRTVSQGRSLFLSTSRTHGWHTWALRQPPSAYLTEKVSGTQIVGNSIIQRTGQLATLRRWKIGNNPQPLSIPPLGLWHLKLFLMPTRL